MNQLRRGILRRPVSIDGHYVSPALPPFDTTMRNIHKIGLAAICGFMNTLVLPPAEVSPWGPVYEFGTCIIDTGNHRETFECYVSTIGERDAFSMEIVRAVSGDPNRDPRIGTYHAESSGVSSNATFQWNDGVEERVQASDFNNPEDWAFWIQGGCGIGFQKMAEIASASR